MKKNMESRRGVAMAEVVIALVVITIISVATLTIMFSSVQIENKTIVAMDVRNQAENAIECFRFADGDVDRFVACLNKTMGDGAPYFIKVSDSPHSYVLNKGGYKTTITVTFDNTHDNTQKISAFKFEAVYSNSQSSDLIYKFEFPKSSNEGGTTE